MDRRTRLISFRLTEQEYRLLEEDCILHRGDKLSSHARGLLCGQLEKSVNADRISDKSRFDLTPEQLLQLLNKTSEVNDLMVKIELSRVRPKL